MDGLVNFEALSPQALIVNMLIGIMLSAVIALFFARFGEALSNRNKLARLFPLLCLTTILIISVVKSSLALSLGLVGALSIVRFRTAIKDPEELAYLFLIIGVGLGLGADQRIATMAAIVIILFVIIVLRLLRPRLRKQNLYLNVEVRNKENRDMFEKINTMLSSYADFVDMRRLDRQGDLLQLTYLLHLKDQHALAKLMDGLKEGVPDCSFSFIDQNSMPGI